MKSCFQTRNLRKLRQGYRKSRIPNVFIIAKTIALKANPIQQRLVHRAPCWDNPDCELFLLHQAKLAKFIKRCSYLLASRRLTTQATFVIWFIVAYAHYELGHILVSHHHLHQISLCPLSPLDDVPLLLPLSPFCRFLLFRLSRERKTLYSSHKVTQFGPCSPLVAPRSNSVLWIVPT